MMALENLSKMDRLSPNVSASSVALDFRIIPCWRLNGLQWRKFHSVHPATSGTDHACAVLHKLV